jgi:hypothetical protein
MASLGLSGAQDVSRSIVEARRISNTGCVVGWATRKEQRRRLAPLGLGPVQVNQAARWNKSGAIVVEESTRKERGTPSAAEAADALQAGRRPTTQGTQWTSKRNG